MKIPAIKHALLVMVASLSFAAIAVVPHFFTELGPAQGAQIPATLVFFCSIYLLGLLTVPALEQQLGITQARVPVVIAAVAVMLPVGYHRIAYGTSQWPAEAGDAHIDLPLTTMFAALWVAGLLSILLIGFRELLPRLLKGPYQRPLLVASLAALLAGWLEVCINTGPRYVEFVAVLPMLISAMVFWRQVLSTLESERSQARVALIRGGAAALATGCYVGFKYAFSYGIAQLYSFFYACFVALAAYAIAATVGDVTTWATKRASSVRVRLFVMGVVAVASGTALPRVDFDFFPEGATGPLQRVFVNIGAFIIVTALVAMFGATLARNMSHSLVRSAAALRDIQKRGKLDKPLDESGLDELSDVARAVNQLAEQLKNTAFLESINADLRSRQEELATALKALREANVELVRSERMASVAGLVKGIAHELNNPINYIAGNVTHLVEYTQFLSRVAGQLAEGTPRSTEEIAALTRFSPKKDLAFVSTDLKKLTADIGEGARRAQLIIRDLQALTTTNQRGIERVDLGRVVQQTVTLLSPKLRPGVRIETDVQPVDPISARAGHLEQVLVNLVDNALRAIGERGTVRVSLASSQGRAVIRVADDGCGMTPEVRRQVFDPFFTTRSAGEGAGLGLAIVAQIVKAHRGDISLESEVGRGSEFAVSIPLETGLAAEATAGG